MNIPFVPADPSNYYSGRGGNSIKYIVMHYTANDGDTDKGNAHYFQGAGRRASAHYFVDEDSVTQSVRDRDAAWHCGGDLESSHHPLRGICMNRNSLGVEMCSDIVDGKYTITPQTFVAYPRLGAQLAGDIIVPHDVIYVNAVLRHEILDQLDGTVYRLRRNGVLAAYDVAAHFHTQRIAVHTNAA